MIELRHVSKSFDDNEILCDVNLTVNKGDCVTLIGASGCGKSTLLRTMILLEPITSGEIYLNGELISANTNIDDVHSRIGLVYQNFCLFSHLTVLENVILAPMVVKKMSKQQAIQEAMKHLTAVGMANRADYPVSKLSGGQKQRAAIARCLAMEPEIILFDEPTSALDPTMVDEVLSVIRMLVKQGLTCVIATHEMEFAKNVSSRIVYIDDHTVYEQGTPDEIFIRPQREKTRIFIQKLKVFEYESTNRVDNFEFSSLLMNYCKRYMLSNKELNTINLVCEEMFSLFSLSPASHFTTIVSLNENTSDKIVYFRYDGEPHNLLELPDADPISLLLIQGKSNKIHYSHIDNENLIEISF